MTNTASEALARLRALNEARTKGEWFAGPLQPDDESTGAPGGVSIGPTDLHDRYGARPDYTPEAFCDHYEDQIALAQGGNHDAEANAAAIVAALNALGPLLDAADVLSLYSRLRQVFDKARTDQSDQHVLRFADGSLVEGPAASLVYEIGKTLDHLDAKARAALDAIAKLEGK